MPLWIRGVVIVGLACAASPARAESAPPAVGSFDLVPGVSDGNVDCPGIGSWGDVQSALLYELPGGDHVVNVYRREQGDWLSILVSKDHTCLFRRMEFHAPPRAQQTQQ